MVLGELGGRLSAALRNMSNADVIDEEVVDELLKEIGGALVHADVNVRVVMELRENIKRVVNLEEMASGMHRRKLLQKAVFEELCAMLDPGVEPYRVRKGEPNVIMFVGLQGSGKTTTCAKVAHYYKSRKRMRTAMVCADTFRAGAFDQLKQLATKAKVPFYGSYTERNPVEIAYEGVTRFREEGYEVILLDTSGRNSQDAALFREMQEVYAAVEPDDIVFVMDSSIGQAAEAQATAFKEGVGVGSVIITKSDSQAKGGGALSAVAATGSPIVFIGTGEHIADLRPFDARGFCSQLLGWGDLKALEEFMREKVSMEDQEAIMTRLTEGTFTLRDMRQQFSTLLSMGSMSSMLSMIPGLDGLLSKGSDEETSSRIKAFLYVMDSMTARELDTQDIRLFTPSRIERIARGSGRSPIEVQLVLQVFTPFAEWAKKMGDPKARSKIARRGKGKGGAMPDMSKLDMGQLARAMDPRILQSVGGVSGLQGVMKSISEGGGLGEMMSKMGSMFGGGGMPPGMMPPGMMGGAGKKGRRGRR